MKAVAGSCTGPRPSPPRRSRERSGRCARQEVRDVVWCAITREEAAAHVRVWRDVVRRSPEELVAPAAGLLAFAAWLAGDGALAWCAIDRSLRSDPDHTLATARRAGAGGSRAAVGVASARPAVLDLDAG